MHNGGAAWVPSWLSSEHCQQVINEINETRLQRSPRHYLNAQQFFANREYRQLAQLPDYMRSLVDSLIEAVQINAEPGRQGTAPSLSAWEPNEFVIQLYDPGWGITWHTDESRNSYLLTTILTLRGQAQFQVEHDSCRWVYAADWRVGPGDLVLLRGINFQGVTFYGRPRHRVIDCSGDRLALILRMRPPTAR